MSTAQEMLQTLIAQIPADQLEQMLRNVQASRAAVPVVETVTDVTLDEMLAACAFTEVNPHIAAGKLGVSGKRFTAQGAKVFVIGKRMNTDEVAAMMAEEGYRPASFETLLAYAKEHPDAQREQEIYALGTHWEPSKGTKLVGCLSGNKLRRKVGLELDVSSYGWDRYSAFIGVPA